MRFSTFGFTTTMLVTGALSATLASAQVPGTELRVADAPHGQGGHSHAHEMLEVPAGQAVPTVNLVVHPDPTRGWNLEVQLTNFRFAPENIANPGPWSEGHAHLYVDGRKLTRLYGNWFHLENLPPGRRQLTVALSTNRHQELTHNGRAIADTEVVEVPVAQQQTQPMQSMPHRH